MKKDEQIDIDASCGALIAKKIPEVKRSGKFYNPNKNRR